MREAGRGRGPESQRVRYCHALLSSPHLLPCSPPPTLSCSPHSYPALHFPLCFLFSSPHPTLPCSPLPPPALSSPLYSQKNMSQATGIFEAISQVLSESPLDFWGANLLSGQDEGSLGWITINYVLDKLVKVLDSTPRG